MKRKTNLFIILQNFLIDKKEKINFLVISINDIQKISIKSRRKNYNANIPRSRLPCILSRRALDFVFPKINRGWAPRYFLRGSLCRGSSAL